MRQRMKNYLEVTANDVDLTTSINIEFYVRQGAFFRQYTPKVTASDKMIVEIPFDDAMKLASGEVRVQFALTDENGTPRATKPKAIPVEELLKEAGYDPV